MKPLNRKASVSRLINNLSLLGDDALKNPGGVTGTITPDINTTPVMKRAYDLHAFTGRN